MQIGLLVLEATACIIGFLNWKKIKTSFWKWFAVYLAVIAICEITGLFLLYFFKETIPSRNLYNYFVIPLEFLFFYWLYYRYYKDKSEKKLALASLIIYLPVFVISVIFFDDVTIWLFPFSYLAGIIMLLILIIIFFFRLMRSRQILHFKEDMMFWVSLGLLVFYVVSSPYFGLKQFLYQKHKDVFWIYYYIQFVVNYLMYLFFCFAFIWGKPR